MANLFVVAVEDVKGFFAKVFKNAPKDAAVALSVLNSAAPLLEAAVTVEEPAVAAVIDPILTVVQADLGTVSSMLANNQISSVGTFLTAIKANFSTLLTEGHITNADSVAKANTFLGVIQSVMALLGVK